MKKQSDFLKLKSADFWKGLLVAILTAIFTSLSSAIGAATDFASFNWQIIVLSAAGGFVGYITKNFLTNSVGEIMKTEKEANNEN